MVNRVFESAGPEGKVRGTPQQIVDKYLTLARDSQTSGDRVTSENFLQHAEHYQRILLDAQGVRDDRRDQSQDGDGDGRDTSGQDEGEEAQADRQRDDRQRDDRQRDDREDERQRDERQDDRAARQGGREDGGERQHESEVGGLTTIDSGAEDNQNLLVEADELSASQPPRRRRNQRRNQPQQSQPAEADNQGE